MVTDKEFLESRKRLYEAMIKNCPGKVVRSKPWTLEEIEQNKKRHKELSDFLEKLDRLEEQARHSRLIVKYQIPSRNYQAA